MYADEFPDGSYVLAEYRGHWDGPPEARPDSWQTVWQRQDRKPRQETGDWWEVCGPTWAQTPSGSVRVPPPSEPVGWGTVCGLDDPEPYGVSQVRLWRDDECEPWAAVARFARWLVSLDDPDPDSAGFQDRRVTTMTRIIERARQVRARRSASGSCSSASTAARGPARS
jgi:hypothetical protein